MFGRSFLPGSDRWRAIRAFTVGANGTSGAALAEVAAVLPILVAILVYTIDFSLFTFTKMEVQNSAQAGVQYAIGQVNYDSTAISYAVTHATKFTAVTPSSSEYCGCPQSTGILYCAASCDACNTGTCPQTVQGHYVTVTAAPATPYKPLVPFGVMSSSGNYNLTAKSTVRIR